MMTSSNICKLNEDRLPIACFSPAAMKKLHSTLERLKTQAPEEGTPVMVVSVCNVNLGSIDDKVVILPAVCLSAKIKQSSPTYFWDYVTADPREHSRKLPYEYKTVLSAYEVCEAMVLASNNFESQVLVSVSVKTHRVTVLSYDEKLKLDIYPIVEQLISSNNEEHSYE